MRMTRLTCPEVGKRLALCRPLARSFAAPFTLLRFSSCTSCLRAAHTPRCTACRALQSPVLGGTLCCASRWWQEPGRSPFGSFCMKRRRQARASCSPEVVKHCVETKVLRALLSSPGATETEPSSRMRMSELQDRASCRAASGFAHCLKVTLYPGFEKHSNSADFSWSSTMRPLCRPLGAGQEVRDLPERTIWSMGFQIAVQRPDGFSPVRWRRTQARLATAREGLQAAPLLYRHARSGYERMNSGGLAATDAEDVGPEYISSRRDQ